MDYIYSGEWKQGELPQVHYSYAVVNYDQKNYAYIIEVSKLEDFKEFVCGEFGEDDWDYECDEPDKYMASYGINLTVKNLEEI